MGYIMPVNHDQYTQYANRQLPVKKDPLELTPIKKTTLTSAFVKKEHEYALEKQSLNVKNQNNKLLSELTGKGHVINEWI
ncbi:hypothetical protein [Litchfieldia salsa]|uniref:Uncharacterized protein n=1 Tax=Litchfieldia salsa TaxID=930152 RepID=A0A1H0S2E6_9BACI|nr:hypothetical protein [Litchfieldia salsa]SDP35870.1 hypothetical protein SAMN05216565_102508 [Litchfieldia salsa]